MISLFNMSKNFNKGIQQYNSKTNYIDAMNVLKILMAFGIVYIHVKPPQIQADYAHNDPLFAYIHGFITEVLLRSCVPTFFLISGYLFFRDGINVDYYKKIGTRLKRYIPPYLIWNSIFLIIFFNVDYSFFDIINLYIKPINFPLWFIRNLIAITICTPIIGYFINHHKFKTLITISIVYLLSNGNEECSTIFYYTFGAILAMNQKCFANLLEKKFLLLAFFVLIVIFGNIAFGGIIWPNLYHSISKLSSVLVNLSLVLSFFLKNKNGSFSNIILKYKCSFLLFVTHALIICVIYVYYPSFYKADNILKMLCVYLFEPILIILTIYIFHSIFIRIVPDKINKYIGNY